MKFKSAIAGLILLLTTHASGVEIPLESVSPVRIGYIDLQKVFDTFPEKAFAEGDLLKEIQKRKTEMANQQNSINVMRRQITADQAALDQAKAGKPTMVPLDEVSTLQPVEPLRTHEPAVTKSTAAIAAERAAAASEPYPMEEPLAGLPGHDGGASSPRTLPGMEQPEPVKPKSSPLLDSLAASGTSSVLSTEAQNALQNRITTTQKALDRSINKFKNYRGKALEDMKQLQTQKTYGVMSKIYAVLQGLARDESITVVLDKTYVLYGEETIDLSEKLITRLNAEQL